MIHPDTYPDLRSAHVIVVGNEKGGAGKSTLSIHLIIALLKAGYSVASIDLDTRQRTLTRFLENRTSWAQSVRRYIEMPYHHALARDETHDLSEREANEFGAFAAAIGAVEHTHEFVVIDTPATDSYLMRLAHSLADTLISPVNDSYIDVDVFSRVNHDKKNRGRIAHYAELVLEARRKRRLADAGMIDWVMVRNRMPTVSSNNSRQLQISLERLSYELDFRLAEGLHDRVIFRELFPIGLTALDQIEEGMPKGQLTSSQALARKEILALLEKLDLPARIEGLEHKDCRHIWFTRVAEYYRERTQAANF